MVQKLTLLENSACHLSASGFQFSALEFHGRDGWGVNIRSPTAPNQLLYRVTSSFHGHDDYRHVALYRVGARANRDPPLAVGRETRADLFL